MKTNSKHNQLRKNQAGLASILVTMIIMLIISLIVLAAARLSRREQRQTLDRQLSTQAFYAAESGVNDAVEKIEADLGLPTPVLLGTDYTDSCAIDPSDPPSFMETTGLDGILNAGDNVKYTCLLVDPTPTTWEANVGDTARAFPVESKTGEVITKIEIAWQDKGGGTNFSCPSNLPVEGPVSAWSCDTPLLRVDLVPTATVTRTALNAALMTRFFVGKNSGPTSIPYAPNGAVGSKQDVFCSTTTTPKYCKIDVDTSLLNTTRFYLRIRSVYGTSSVTVSGYRNASDRVELKGAQVVIDSTGVAADVLRRIQVRVPLSGVGDVPEFAIQSGDHICKLLEVSSSANSSNAADCPID